MDRQQLAIRTHQILQGAGDAGFHAGDLQHKGSGVQVVLMITEPGLDFRRVQAENHHVALRQQHGGILASRINDALVLCILQGIGIQVHAIDGVSQLSQTGRKTAPHHAEAHDAEGAAAARPFGMQGGCGCLFGCGHFRTSVMSWKKSGQDFVTASVPSMTEGEPAAQPNTAMAMTIRWSLCPSIATGWSRRYPSWP